MTKQNVLAVGDQIELKITGIAHGGITVARHDGRVVFVADAIPGETVIAEITEAKKKSFARAVTISVVEASPDRVAHIWPEAGLERAPFDRVGGAEFGHIKLERQRALKAEVLNDSMKRFAGIETSATVVAAPGDDENNGLGWRSRVRIHVDQETGISGPYAARSRRVIEVDSLPLANEQINLIAPLNEYMPDVESIDVVAPSDDDPRSLFTYPGEKKRAGENDPVHETVAGIPFIVSAGGFWQVHREAPAVLFEGVRDAILGLGKDFDPKAPNLDLYGGVGIFARAVLEAGGKATKITSVEALPIATDMAAENLADFIGAMAITDRVDKYLQKIKSLTGATVVLDPPRSGAGLQITGRLVELNPKNLVYVACDPVALARDAGALLKSGYKLITLQGYDLFPHTHHFESIAIFQK